MPATRLATLWKNGLGQNPSVSGNRSIAHSVAVSGSDVYAAGYNNGATLWRNGARQQLDLSGSNNSEAFAVFAHSPKPPESTIAVAVSPANSKMAVGATKAFSATISGGDNAGVIWSVPPGHGAITQDGIYTAPDAPGIYAITAASAENPLKRDTVLVAVHTAFVAISDPPVALIADETVTFRAEVFGLDDDSIIWTATAGTIDQATGGFRAPLASQVVTITAESVQNPELSDSVQVKISAADFDGNTKTNPQLLDLANAIGSTNWADLLKYDLNGDGVIDDEDLRMLFRGMGW
jgi:hypothetical protein